MLISGETLHTRGATHKLYEEALKRDLLPPLAQPSADGTDASAPGAPVFEQLKAGSLEGWLGAWGIFDARDRKLLGNIAEAAAPVLENARLLERLEREATTDPLTRISNRRFFTMRLEEEIARAKRSNTPISLIMLDIDYFKSVNDTFGHPAGDRVLKTISLLLAESIRLEDLADRLGGEEFAIMLPGTQKEGSMEVAERILQRAPEMELGIERIITVSLGGAIATPEDTAETLIGRADLALYNAKNTGRNRICWSDA